MPFEQPGFRHHLTAESAFIDIKRIYDQNIARITSLFHDFLDGKKVELAETLEAVYPAIYFEVLPRLKNETIQEAHHSYGILGDFELYGTTLTAPDIFKSYYLEQFEKILTTNNVRMFVGPSKMPIPLPYVVEHFDKGLTEAQYLQFQSLFPMPNLLGVNDDVANSIADMDTWDVAPLSLFTAERVDYSLNRLYHYTGTHPSHFQGMVLLTNYQRYVKEFISYGIRMMGEEPETYIGFEGPEGLSVAPDTLHLFDRQDLKKPPQMPAYHLKRPDGNGVTLINIGVGPSNAKTITDHLAVLRPQCWIMVGHCGGLRRRQLLGDYVLAHAYVRDDHVLDAELPTWVPIPSLVEVQIALERAFQDITKLNRMDTKSRLRTGTVFTTDNRNWELRARDFYPMFRLTRSIAVDMESATIAANGFRFRVPYGALLCVSDKPVHGELKLRGMANAFYEQRIGQHLLIGLKALELLRAGGMQDLHSRKLRGFHETPFR